MSGVEFYAAVRLAVVEGGLSHHQAGRRFGIDRRTVKKMQNYSSPLNPCSSRSRSKIRCAVCRCLRGPQRNSARTQVRRDLRGVDSGEGQDRTPGCVGPYRRLLYLHL